MSTVVVLVKESDTLKALSYIPALVEANGTCDHIVTLNEEAAFPSVCKQFCPVLIVVFSSGLTFLETVRDYARRVPVLFLLADSNIGRQLGPVEGVTYLAESVSPDDFGQAARRLLRRRVAA